MRYHRAFLAVIPLAVALALVLSSATVHAQSASSKKPAAKPASPQAKAKPPAAKSAPQSKTRGKPEAARAKSRARRAKPEGRRAVPPSARPRHPLPPMDFALAHLPMLRALHEAARTGAWKRIGKPAVEVATSVLSGNSPKLFSDLVAQLLSGNHTKLLVENKPEVLTGDHPKVLSGNEARLLSGNKANISDNEASCCSHNQISLFSNIKIEIYVSGTGNQVGGPGPHPPMPPHAAPTAVFPAPYVPGYSQPPQQPMSSRGHAPAKPRQHGPEKKPR